jgi:hypothetical protein
MQCELVQSLMEQFAEGTGLIGTAKPRRYLWTDAFAVCNFLGLARKTGDDRFLQYATTLVDQVHFILGRHREDGERRGWISGLSESEGREHPTWGGLRIGKPLNERSPSTPFDSQLEWDRDGQYFHYLTKWMRALHCMGRETGDPRYIRWAIELAVAASHGFVRPLTPGGARRIAWKMSIDLSRPLVPSAGQHDPLDGLISCLQLQTVPGLDVNLARSLTPVVDAMDGLCARGYWPTDDPLGIGGLLDDAARLIQLVFEHHLDRRELLFQLLIASEKSLYALGSVEFLGRSAEHRLAFRELGLSIGIAGIRRANQWVVNDRELANICHRLAGYSPLREQIQNFWIQLAARQSATWLEHADINSVMLATSLSPESYLQLEN